VGASFSYPKFATFGADEPRDGSYGVARRANAKHLTVCRHRVANFAKNYLMDVAGRRKRRKIIRKNEFFKY